MLARIFSCAVIGLDGVVVEVEVDTGLGLPGMTIVGLPDIAVQESRERVQAAVKNAGIEFPRKRIIVNLAPASVRKEGPAYDLPIALGVLVMMGRLHFLIGLETVLFADFLMLAFKLTKGFLTVFGAAYLFSVGLAIGVIIRMGKTIEYLPEPATTSTWFRQGKGK